MTEERKYFVKNSWVFNLESMNDKVWCLIYDLRDGNLNCPFTVAGTLINDESDLHNLLDEANELEWIAKSRKVTSKEYGRIKNMVNWRVAQRYQRCMESGMNERDAGQCFAEI